MTVLLFFIIPIKIKWLAIIDGVFFAIEIVGAILSGNVVGAITPVLALLNFALFATPYIHYMRRRTQYRHSAGAVNFRRTVHQAQKQQQNAPYHHKCAVCGRTDTDYPRPAVPLLQQVCRVSLLLPGSYFLPCAFHRGALTDIAFSGRIG